jgi:Cu/Zn superoxide dismutase
METSREVNEDTTFSSKPGVTIPVVQTNFNNNMVLENQLAFYGLQDTMHHIHEQTRCNCQAKSETTPIL